MAGVRGNLEFLFYNTSQFRFSHHSGYSWSGDFNIFFMEFQGNSGTAIYSFTVFKSLQHLGFKNLIFNTPFRRTTGGPFVKPASAYLEY